MPLVAEKIAQKEACDEVQSVGLSMDRSTRNNLVFFVWAKNRTKFYISESELDGDSSVQSEQEKLVGLLKRHEIMAEKAVKNSLQFPTTFKRPIFGVSRARTTPNSNEIIFDFSAQNTFGLQITYTAMVLINSDSEVIDIRMEKKK
jgi:hypothetical protein